MKTSLPESAVIEYFTPGRAVIEDSRILKERAVIEDYTPGKGGY